MLVSYIFMALLYSLELMMCMFTTVTNNVRPNYLSVRPKLSLFGHVSMQNQIVIFSTAVAKKITGYAAKDCQEMLHELLHICWHCPRDEDIVDVKPGSTTVVLLIDKAFIIQYSATASSLWAYQEFRVTRVRVGAFELNVVQLLTQHFKEALRSGLTGGMDFVGATKVCGSCELLVLAC